MATVSGRPVFDVVRMRMGLNIGLVTLIASLLINLLTLAAEVGGAAIVLQLLFDLNVSTLILLAVVALVLIVYFVPFGGIERIFGYLGCALLVYVAAAVHLKPELASGRSGADSQLAFLGPLCVLRRRRHRRGARSLRGLLLLLGSHRGPLDRQ